MTAADPFEVLEATWPAAATHRVGPWQVRAGKGGGKRVSCATTRDEQADLAGMEAAQAELGQAPLVMVRDDQPVLDARLAAAGYRRIDPTLIYAAPATDLLCDLPRVRVFTAQWPPLQVMCEIWDAGGIGPDRRAVMARARGPKTGLMGRAHDRPAATAFLCMAGKTAMIHALEVSSSFRRQGLARHMMGAAARWTLDHGGDTLALAVTRANGPATALYSSLTMRVVGKYAYRQCG